VKEKMVEVFGKASLRGATDERRSSP
jgi:hypothetical protein